MNATQTTKINLIKYTVVIFQGSSGFISSLAFFFCSWKIRRAHKMAGKFQPDPSLTHLKAFIRNIKKAKE